MSEGDVLGQLVDGYLITPKEPTSEGLYISGEKSVVPEPHDHCPCMRVRRTDNTPMIATGKMTVRLGGNED